MHESRIENRKFGLIVVAAPSGAGKSTLCTHLLKDLNARLELSISSTSRLPRGTEVHGKEYFFLTADDFKTKVESNHFAEWALVHGNYYGTAKQTVNEVWSREKHVLLDIDVQGASSLKTIYPDRCYRIFIAPPSMQELERRLRGRGTEAEELVQKRMKNAQDEMAKQSEFEFVLVNDAFDSAYQQLRAKVTEVMNAWEKGESF